jgi:hypothetical protein
MNEDTWIGTLPDGRIVKYGYKELSDGVAALSAKVEGRLVMIVQKDVRAPVTREEVAALFEHNLPAEDCGTGSVEQRRDGEASA